MPAGASRRLELAEFAHDPFLLVREVTEPAAVVAGGLVGEPSELEDKVTGVVFGDATNQHRRGRGHPLYQVAQATTTAQMTWFRTNTQTGMFIRGSLRLRQ